MGTPLILMLFTTWRAAWKQQILHPARIYDKTILILGWIIGLGAMKARQSILWETHPRGTRLAGGRVSARGRSRYVITQLYGAVCRESQRYLQFPMVQAVLWQHHN